MKQMILLVCLTMSLFCYAQKSDALKDINSIKFYGVDYSKAKVFGATESAAQFITAFRGINDLFFVEAKKYNVSKQLKKEVTEISIDAVNKVNNNINQQELFTTDQQYVLGKKDIEAAINALPIQKTKGVGMVFVAGLLNKPANKGTYEVVFFNTETKEIIEQWITSGKTGGLGLRNFWAGSVYKALKNL